VVPFEFEVMLAGGLEREEAETAKFGKTY